MCPNNVVFIKRDCKHCTFSTQQKGTRQDDIHARQALLFNTLLEIEKRTPDTRLTFPRECKTIKSLPFFFKK